MKEVEEFYRLVGYEVPFSKEEVIWALKALAMVIKNPHIHLAEYIKHRIETDEENEEETGEFDLCGHVLSHILGCSLLGYSEFTRCVRVRGKTIEILPQNRDKAINFLKSRYELEGALPTLLKEAMLKEKCAINRFILQRTVA